MKIYDYLKKDHQKVTDLFEEIFSMPRETATDFDQQEDVFEELIEELLLHAETEKNSFYQALSNGLKEDIHHAKEEHEAIEALILKTNTLAPSEDKWLKNIKELQKIVEQHVKYEEENIFEKAKNILDENQEKTLVKKMEDLKGKEAVLPLK